MAKPDVAPSPPALEVDLGLATYATPTPGVGGRLRASPEDFVVMEVPLPPRPAKGPGKYTLLEVRARNWETNSLMREIRERLGVPKSGLFFSGTKDKRAVTTQWIAVRAPEEAVQRLRLRDVDVLRTYRADRAPKTGELTGNRFDIRVRGLDVDVDEAGARAHTVVKALQKVGGFPNFFGLQRFGTRRPVTHEVGRHIVHGDLGAAFWTYAANPGGDEGPGNNARARLQDLVDEARDARSEVAAAKAGLAPPDEGGLPTQFQFERQLLQGLVDHEGDHRRAFLRLPRNLLSMFTYAYQSILFNRVVARRLAADAPLETPVVGDVVFPATDEGLPDRRETIPVTDVNLPKVTRQVAAGNAFVTGFIPGPDTRRAGGVQGELEAAALAEEGVAWEAFACPALPEAGSDGTRRELLCPLGDVDVEAGTDVAGDHLRLRFFLPRGAYATCLLREVMKAAPDAY